ncbi:MAG TPA: NAD(P)-binding protein [Oligoflexia bacterium]|nr:NAD(P)-binding protein [Oligoflexia bacterium]HMP26596.1 NAD(P)-binding protein [Oligoflexia bacterium]
MANKADLIVIGGGLSGLLAAYFAFNNGRKDIAIIDPEQLGGALKTETVEDHPFDVGPTVFNDRPQVLTLINQLGLQNELLQQNVKFPRTAVALGADLIDLQTGFLSCLFATGLSVVGALQGLRGIFSEFRFTFSESVADVADKQFGIEVRSKLIDPVVRAMTFGDSTKVNFEAVFGSGFTKHRGLTPKNFIFKSDVLKRKLLAFKSGSVVLSKALIAKTPHKHVVAKTDKVSPAEGGGFKMTLSNGEEWFAREVVLAIGTKPLIPLVKNLDADLYSKLSVVECVPLGIVNLYSDTKPNVPSDVFEVVAPAASPNYKFISASSRDLIFPKTHRGYNIKMIYGGSDGDWIFEKGKEELGKLAQIEAARVLKTKSIKTLAVGLWKDAVPLYGATIFDLVKSAKLCENKYPGLKLFGNYYGGITISDRIEQAFGLFGVRKTT